MSETADPDDPNGIQVGDIYEDCSLHPVLCTAVDEVAGVVLSGISFIDCSFPRSCDALRCGPRQLRPPAKGRATGSGGSSERAEAISAPSVDRHVALTTNYGYEGGRRPSLTMMHAGSRAWGWLGESMLFT